MKARLKNYRQAPRKVRLVADSVRGRSVDQALANLTHTPKRAASAVKKLIQSAVSNSKQSEKDLRVKKITVDEGFHFTRYQPRSRGRATPIKKRTSHINVELEKVGK